ncbi:protein-tyrosine phosphatase [Fimicolochytrium jonesii]|uniref:protein-tyrosine phosphatase n=1 Tax=Fimicolochytrium jonesii TaxID=1396493 RepID=UPI0022FEC96C|nr:protein-tyrosine phosphatase [Fimicolochytrium jonesii]KAI8818386.1 protein-tyrosine phosphatase [Fimicolochytrium jonesii]
MALLLTPSENFGQVERGIYRSAPIHPAHFPYLRTLGLKTLLTLSPEPIPSSIQTFCDDRGIKTVPLGHQTWRPNRSWRPVSEEMIKEGLETLLNSENHPVLVTCLTGLHDTGTLIGCLRKLQGWNFNTIIVEYRSYTGGQGRYGNEQFIELFDMDLVTLPRSLPAWFTFHQSLLEEEEQKLLTDGPG